MALINRQRRRLLQAAGFEDVQERPTALPVQVGVLVARRGGA